LATPSDPAVTPNCSLAHDLLNKLTAILGQCEMLQPEVTTEVAAQRVAVIRELAAQLAQTVIRHQCALDKILRSQVDLSTAPIPIDRIP
jgi:signal transduction histidine kinase